MPTFNNTGKMVAYFLFNQVLDRFGVPKAIVMDHGKNFRNHMMIEIAVKLGISHEKFTPYY